MLNSETTEQTWLARLTRLNPATGKGECRGKAPHKPLLLLALLDMAEAGELPSRAFTRSAGLVLRFRCYSAIITERWPTRLDIDLPFFHLSTQGFWVPLDAEMRQARSADSCVVCEMQSELFDLLASPGFRLKARMVIVSKYFEPAERIAFFESLGIHAGNGGAKAAERVLAGAVEAAKRKGRSARFSVRVAAEYRYTCALTGYRCTTSEGTTIVDAAHIEAWRQRQNDDLTNGLALSKNAHWMFDEGLWSVDGELRILVNPRKYTEHGPDSLRLASFAGRHLQFDPDAKLRPGREFLRDHRLHFGFRL